MYLIDFISICQDDGSPVVVICDSGNNRLAFWSLHFGIPIRHLGGGSSLSHYDELFEMLDGGGGFGGFGRPYDRLPRLSVLYPRAVAVLRSGNLVMLTTSPGNPISGSGRVSIITVCKFIIYFFH
jgi:hypothetical protein